MNGDLVRRDEPPGGVETVDYIDDEGLVVSADELDRFTYAVRFEVPEKMRALGEHAYTAGYLDAIRAREPFGAQLHAVWLGNAASEILFAATRGWTKDDRANPWRTWS